MITEKTQWNTPPASFFAHDDVIFNLRAVKRMIVSDKGEIQVTRQASILGS